MRGPLATFDAGNSWHPIAVDGGIVVRLAVRGTDFSLETASDRFWLGPGGDLSTDPRGASRSPLFTPLTPLTPSVARTEAPSARPSPGPFARRPLRAAVEDGWPVTSASGDLSAVVAEGGDVYRVALRTGAVVDMSRRAFREDDGTCHAIPLGASFGFVCGAEGVGTAIYAFEPPLAVREVARFASPRVVLASGNGGVVVRGGCARTSDDMASSERFCFMPAGGGEREVMPPQVGARDGSRLRPVVLADGRALFVLPPRESSPGALFVGDSPSWNRVPLEIAAQEAGLSHLGLLEGVEEASPGVLGRVALGWRRDCAAFASC